MKIQDLKKFNIPDTFGVYFFVGPQNKIIYIGKATSLKDRVRSYFSKDLGETRGQRVVKMIDEAKGLKWQKTDSVLEALVLESYLIKKHRPKYNSDEKDDKSFNYVVITEEEFPRVLIARGRDLENKSKAKNLKVKVSFGPFPRGGLLKEALKIIRKIFPFRDKCLPKTGKPCFNRQIGLCPGVCSGEISKDDYTKRIGHLRLFFQGKTREIVINLTRDMKKEAKNHNFEKASEIKKIIFSLTHIQDVAIMKRERIKGVSETGFRIEAYDVAHLSGTGSVGVMTVITDGEADKNEYRKFRLRISHKGDDLASLEEVLRRRFNHPEWRFPNLVVIDGGRTHKNRADRVIGGLGISVGVVSVVKDEKHKPKEVLGLPKHLGFREREILLANNEAHRFAISYHRDLRSRI